MKLAAIQYNGSEVAAVMLQDGALPLEALPEKFPTQLGTLLRSGRIEELRNTVGHLEGTPDEAIPLSEVEYAPPYRDPSKLWGIGLNYTRHAGDLSADAPVEEPASFMKPATTIIGPGENIRLPKQSNRVTGEAELGVVIGREAKNVSEDETWAVIGGFVCVLDMTAEDILMRNPRYLTRSKSFDTFFSFGPHLVTPDEVGSVADLEVSTVLNGEVHRSDRVSGMIFSPEQLVAFHSRVMTLLPGDIISTGTPGATPLKPGDVLECRIGGGSRSFEPLMNPVEEDQVIWMEMQ
ncbi:MAG: fumarylacetoacetate hydrolase family protein [Actinomycetota bacterium]|nr:fumarylacetoacetate hydrolase family protein [Actinomycetota bacterium]